MARQVKITMMKHEALLLWEYVAAGRRGETKQADITRRRSLHGIVAPLAFSVHEIREFKRTLCQAIPKRQQEI